MARMRVLVAGGTGFVGASAVRRLVSGGHDVRVMTAHLERSSRRIVASGASPVPGDVLDPPSLPGAVQGVEAVVQALTFPTFPVEKPRRRFTFEEFDHRGTERLAHAASAAGVRRYVYVSGSGAAPDAGEAWFRAKWAGEEAVRASGLSHAIVRPSWVYGPDDVALNRLLWFARHSPAVPVIGPGTQRLQPVFVDDVGETLAQAAALDGPEGTFEIGGPDVVTMNDLLRTAMDVMRRRKPLVHVPAFVPRLAGLFLQFLPSPLLSPAAVSFITGEALADTRGLLEAFELRPRPLQDGLATYLAP